MHCWEFTEAYLKTKPISMGISIEQYLSSIGSHDNFVKTKDILSRSNNHFWSLMFVMFYLNVFYLPVLKQVVGQHKMWNDVMFWFSQMIFYNAYFPLLIRQANRLIQQDNGNLTWRRRAQCKYPNMVKLEQNPDYSARSPVVIWRSRPIAKSA